MFTYRHRVQFYETDQMGIVHHSNYVRFCEEARVAWAYDAQIIDYQKKDSASQFAVIGSDVRYLKPAYFGDELAIEVQGRLDGAKITFEYKVYCAKRGDRILNQLLCEARTMHVSLKDLRPQRPHEGLLKVFEQSNKGNSVWIETWLSSL